MTVASLIAILVGLTTVTEKFVLQPLQTQITQTQALIAQTQAQTQAQVSQAQAQTQAQVSQAQAQTQAQLADIKATLDQVPRLAGQVDRLKTEADVMLSKLNP